MSIGPSGRVVVEIDPELKRKLYSELAIRGVTLKEWFTKAAETLVSEKEIKSPVSKSPDEK